MHPLPVGIINQVFVTVICTDTSMFSSDLHQKDPKKAVTIKFHFSPHTSNPSLRCHLDNHHRKAYEIFCKENKYPNQLPSFKHISAAGGQAALDDAGRSDLRPRMKFSAPHFIKHLVNFIVADDQVSAMSLQGAPTSSPFQSINVVECREFRDLLILLRNDLKEEDIPRRTKIREEIMKAWEKWFTALKKELQVRPCHFRDWCTY